MKSVHLNFVLKLTFEDEFLWRIIEKRLTKIEPKHDKTNKMTFAPAMTQMNLGIRPI